MITEGKIMKSKTFEECPKCHLKYDANTFKQTFQPLHKNEERYIMICPQCGKHLTWIRG
jgi:uncharacterized CHY-type Zn-finger protein